MTIILLHLGWLLSVLLAAQSLSRNFALVLGIIFLIVLGWVLCFLVSSVCLSYGSLFCLVECTLWYFMSSEWWYTKWWWQRYGHDYSQRTNLLIVSLPVWTSSHLCLRRIPRSIILKVPFPFVLWWLSYLLPWVFFFFFWFTPRFVGAHPSVVPEKEYNESYVFWDLLIYLNDSLTGTEF